MRDYEEFEGRIEHTTEKSRLVEMTLGGRYWLPKKCTIDFNPSDGDGNFMFAVTTWWWNKRHDFDADRPRDAE